MMHISTQTTGTAYEMPASAAQRYIFLHSAQKPSAWNVAVRFRLQGPLHAARLETAINRVVDQHEVLRTCFTVSEGMVEQRITESCFVPLACFDVSAEGPRSAAEIDRISKQEARRIFKLDSWPLMRAGLIKTAHNDHILLLTLHHAVCDGWSVGIVASDIMRAYAAACEGVPFCRDEAALQYADFSVAQNEYANTPEYRAHAGFWKRQVARLAETQPAEPRNATSADDEAEIHSRLLPLDLTQQIEALARREDLTFFEVVLSAFALARMLATGRPETAFATPVSGRNSSETETMVGTFVNYLPVHLTGNPALTLAAFRRATADTVHELQAHAEYRTEELLAKSPDSLAPFLEHIFICQRDFVPTVKGGGVELSAVPSVSPGALHAMTFFLVERAGSWRASCEIHRSLYSSTDAEQSLDSFEQILRSFAEGPDATVASMIDPTWESPAASEAAAGAVLEFPASEAQQRYWMLQQLQSEKGALLLRIRLRMHGAFDPEIARRALRLLIDRHEALRTTLFADEDILHQRIHPAGVEPDFEVRDVRGLELRAAAIAAADKLHREDDWNFNSEQQSWLRALVLILSSAESILAITLPHTLADGWSCGILLREFYTAYESLSKAEEPRFEPLPLQYAGAAMRKPQWLSSGAMHARIAWWKSHLPGKLAPVAIPAEREHAAPAKSGAGVFTLDPMLTVAVKQFAQDQSATLFSVYGAALLGLLARYTGQRELSLVTPFANRSAETERIVGPFAIPVLVHTSAPADASFQATLNAFQHDAMETFENAIPLERCVELTILQSRLGRHAANQISFFYQTAFVGQALASGFTATPMPATATGTAFEWQFAVIDYGTDVRIEFQYDANLWSEAGIRLCVEHYQRLLSECIFHPEKPVAKIEIATEEERALARAPESLLPISRRALNLSVPDEEIPAVQREFSAPVAPRSDLERTLVAIWRQVFHSDAIGIDDDFFQLGGHSLILARIQAQLKRAMGHRMVAADIFAAPTIAQLAERLQAVEDHPRQPRIFALRPAGGQPPLFLISQSMVFRRMVQCLHPDLPVYTVLMQEEDIKNKPLATFEQIASHYVKIIRSAWPSGPYRVGGWCVSSWLAYEIAQQLRAAGEQVDLLMLVDGWAPGYWRSLGHAMRLAAKSNYYYARAVRHARILAGMSLEEKLAFLQEKWRLMLAATSRQLATLFYSAGLGVEIRVEGQTTLVDQIVYAASRSYTPRPYSFPALVFRSAEQPQGTLLPADLGWSDLLERRVDAIPLPGDHQEIFNDPGAQILAQAVSDFLQLPPADPADAGASEALRGMQPVNTRTQQPGSCALANI